MALPSGKVAASTSSVHNPPGAATDHGIYVTHTDGSIASYGVTKGSGVPYFTATSVAGPVMGDTAYSSTYIGYVSAGS